MPESESREPRSHPPRSRATPPWSPAERGASAAPSRCGLRPGHQHRHHLSQLAARSRRDCPRAGGAHVDAFALRTDLTDAEHPPIRRRRRRGVRPARSAGQQRRPLRAGRARRHHPRAVGPDPRYQHARAILSTASRISAPPVAVSSTSARWAAPPLGHARPLLRLQGGAAHALADHGQGLGAGGQCQLRCAGNDCPGRGRSRLRPLPRAHPHAAQRRHRVLPPRCSSSLPAPTPSPAGSWPSTAASALASLQPLAHALPPVRITHLFRPSPRAAPLPPSSSRPSNTAIGSP